MCVCVCVGVVLLVGVASRRNFVQMCTFDLVEFTVETTVSHIA